MNAAGSFINSIDRRSPTWVGRCLGAFVCFQLIATPLSNYIKLIPVRFPEYHGEINGDLQTRLPESVPAVEPFQTIVDGTAWTLARWSEVSGQGQCWALFTSFGTRMSFPIVELHWPDREPVRLTCHFEPADPTNYFYPPEPCCRLFNYEYRMALIHSIMLPEWEADPEKYRYEVVNSIADMQRSISTYLRWKSGRYLSEHPELPKPESIVLIARVWPDPPPGASRLNRPSSYEIPIARSLSSSDALDAYDPVAKVWQRLPKVEAP